MKRKHLYFNGNFSYYVSLLLKFFIYTMPDTCNVFYSYKTVY